MCGARAKYFWIITNNTSFNQTLFPLQRILESCQNCKCFSILVLKICYDLLLVSRAKLSTVSEPFCTEVGWRTVWKLVLPDQVENWNCFFFSSHIFKHWNTLYSQANLKLFLIKCSCKLITSLFFFLSLDNDVFNMAPWRFTNFGKETQYFGS